MNRTRVVNYVIGEGKTLPEKEPGPKGPKGGGETGIL